jgi:hypothetical protein
LSSGLKVGNATISEGGQCRYLGSGRDGLKLEEGLNSFHMEAHYNGNKKSCNLDPKTPTSPTTDTVVPLTGPATSIHASLVSPN